VPALSGRNEQDLPIKGVNPKDNKEVERKPVASEPLTAYVFKTVAEPLCGQASIFRVYSGVLKADSTVLNASSGSKERIGQVFYLQGKKHVPAQSVGPGEIAAVVKLKDTNVGDTLCEEHHRWSSRRYAFADPIISYCHRAEDEGRRGEGQHRPPADP